MQTAASQLLNLQIKLHTCSLHLETLQEFSHLLLTCSQRRLDTDLCSAWNLCWFYKRKACLKSNRICASVSAGFTSWDLHGQGSALVPPVRVTSYWGGAPQGHRASVTKWLVLGHAAIPLGPPSIQTSSLPPWSVFFFLPVPIVAYFMRAVHSKDTKTVGVR